MQAGFGIFGPAHLYVDERLDGFLATGVSNVIAEVAGPLRAALVLYVLLYGVAILRGAISEPIMDLAVRALKLALIYLLATTPAYEPWVTEPLFHVLPETLARAVGGAPVGDAGQACDRFFGRAAYLGDKISDQATLTDWSPLLVSGAVWVCGALAAALAFGILMLAKVALAFIVALGPIFIACSLFEATRRYFFGWLSQAVNYLVLFALVLLLLELVLAFVADQWGAIDGEDAIAGGLLFIALSLLGAIFFLQTPAIAAGIAGGASIGLADFAAGGGSRQPPHPNAGGSGARPQVRREGGFVRPIGVHA